MILVAVLTLVSLAQRLATTAVAVAVVAVLEAPMILAAVQLGNRLEAPVTWAVLVTLEPWEAQ